MSKIILESMASENINQITLARPVVQTKDIMHLVYDENDVPYLYIGKNKLNVVISGDIAYLTQYQPEERPDLNIQPVTISVLV